MAGVYAFRRRVGIDTSNPTTKFFDDVEEGIRQVKEIVDANGTKGTRTHYASRKREGRKRIGGPIRLNPTPVEFSNLMLLIMGAGTAAAPTLAETIPLVYVQVDRSDGTDGKVYTYDGGFNRATVSGSSGQPLSLDLDFVGKTETEGNAGTFPGGFAIDTTTAPFMFHDLVMTIGGTPYSCFDYRLTIDNAIDTERFLNSQTLTAIHATDRNIMVETSLPFGDAELAYALAATGVSVVATFTNGNTSLTITTPLTQVETQTANANGRGEFVLPIRGSAGGSAAGNEMTMAIDFSP